MFDDAVQLRLARVDVRAEVALSDLREAVHFDQALALIAEKDRPRKVGPVEQIANVVFLELRHSGALAPVER